MTEELSHLLSFDFVLGNDHRALLPVIVNNVKISKYNSPVPAN